MAYLLGADNLLLIYLGIDYKMLRITCHHQLKEKTQATSDDPQDTLKTSLSCALLDVVKNNVLCDIIALDPSDMVVNFAELNVMEYLQQKPCPLTQEDHEHIFNRLVDKPELPILHNMNHIILTRFIEECHDKHLFYFNKQFSMVLQKAKFHCVNLTHEYFHITLEDYIAD